MSLMCDCHVFIIYIVAICWTVREQNLCQCEARLNALSAICSCAITRTYSGGLVMLQVLPRRCRCVSAPSRPASPHRFISATTRRAHPSVRYTSWSHVKLYWTDISDNNIFRHSELKWPHTVIHTVDTDGHSRLFLWVSKDFQSFIWPYSKWFLIPQNACDQRWC